MVIILIEVYLLLVTLQISLLHRSVNLSSIDEQNADVPDSEFFVSADNIIDVDGNDTAINSDISSNTGYTANKTNVKPHPGSISNVMTATAKRPNGNQGQRNGNTSSTKADQITVNGVMYYSY